MNSTTQSSCDNPPEASLLNSQNSQTFLTDSHDSIDISIIEKLSPKTHKNSDSPLPIPEIIHPDSFSKDPEQSYVNPAIKDPRLEAAFSRRVIGMEFRQSYSSFLSEVYLKLDEYSIGLNESSSILVTNIPLTATSDQLMTRFKIFGPISKVELPKCPLTYASLGIARIIFGEGTMRHPASAQPALDAVAFKDTIVIDGAILHICLDPLGIHLKELMAIERARASSHISNLIQPLTLSNDHILPETNNENIRSPFHSPGSNSTKFTKDYENFPPDSNYTSLEPRRHFERHDDKFVRNFDRSDKFSNRRFEKDHDRFIEKNHVYNPEPNFHRPSISSPYSKYSKFSPRRHDRLPSELSDEGAFFHSKSPSDYRRKPHEPPRNFRNNQAEMRDRGNMNFNSPREPRGNWFDSPRSQRQARDNFHSSRLRDSVPSEDSFYGKEPYMPRELSPEPSLPFMTRALHWPQDPYPFPEFISSFPNLPIITSQFEDSSFTDKPLTRVSEQVYLGTPNLPPEPKIDHCISFDSKYLPLFITTEKELMVHFQHYNPKEVTKEQRCWVVIFETKGLAEVCLSGPEAQNFRGYHLTGKLQSLEAFRNPSAAPVTSIEIAAPSLSTAHKILPSTGLPSFKKFTNSLRSNNTDQDTFTPQSLTGEIQASPLDRINGRLLKNHTNHIHDNLQQSLSPKSKLIGVNDSPNQTSGLPDTTTNESNQPGTLSQSHDATDPKIHEDNKGKDSVENHIDKMVLVLDSENSSPQEPETPEASLPIHSTGCARTEKIYKLNPELKKFRQTIPFSATGVRRGPQPSRWVPISAKARKLSRNLDESGRRIALSRSGIHDWGLFTLLPLKKGELVIEYVGELIRSNLADVRERHYLASGIDSSYLFRLDDEYVVDATTQGNIARFINHSCQPNCLARIVRSESRPRILIYAKTDITSHQEITYDYQFPLEDEEHKIKCLCNTPVCRGYLN